MSDDPRNLMSLADALVTALGEASLSVAFDAAWTDDALADLADDTFDKAQVWVVDFAESLLPASDSQHGVPIEDLELLLVIQQRFAPGADRAAKCKALGHLASEIARFCRATVVEDATCVKTVRKPARDLKLYHETGMFRSELLTTWHRAQDEE
jgi:hypothetical protein